MEGFYLYHYALCERNISEICIFLKDINITITDFFTEANNYVL